MGRVYAGILGPISFGVVVARSLIDGDSVDTALYAAPLALFAFAAIGYVIGFIAERTIVEAVEAQFHAQLQGRRIGSDCRRIDGDEPRRVVRTSRHDASDPIAHGLLPGKSSETELTR